jgi:hypothetical protein
VIPYARILGKDCDAALALQLVRIHHALDDFFVGSKEAALPQHRINKSCFSMVDMRNDCYIARVDCSIFNSHLVSFIVSCEGGCATL